MSCKTIKEVIVVEGKNDTNHLKEFFDVETIETSGLGLSKTTIKLIETINKKRGVILLLDPDSPGEKIRKRINDVIPGLKNAFLFKKNARTSKKVGVEHASKEVIEKALLSYITYVDSDKYLSYEDFVKAGLVGRSDSSKRREEVSLKYNLGHCNAKTLYKRLKMIGVVKL